MQSLNELTPLDDEQAEREVDRIVELQGRARRGKPHFVRQHDELDCAAACLESINRHYGKRIGLARVRELVKVGREGASLYHIKTAAEELGHATVALRAPVSELAQLPLPAITVMDYHFVVVYRIHGDRLLVSDPELALHWNDAADFSEDYRGYCMLLAPTDKFEAQEETRPNYRQYFSLVRPHRSLLLRAFVASTVLLLLGVAGPILTQVILDDVLRLGSLQLLALVCGGYLAVLVFSRAMTFARMYFLMHVGNQLELSLSSSFYRHLFSLKAAFFSRRSVGDITNLFDELGEVREFLTGEVLVTSLQVIHLVVYFALVFQFSTELGLLALLVVPVFFAISWLTAPFLKRLRYGEFNKQARVDTLLTEHITSVQTIKALGAEPRAQRGWEERLVELVEQRERGDLTVAPIRFVVALVDGGTRLAVLYFGARLVIAGSLSAGELIAATMLVDRILSPISDLAMKWSSLQDTAVSIEKVDDVLNMPTEDFSFRGRAPESFAYDCLRLDDVSFTYGHPEEMVLRGFSATFRKGDITALVGRSGCGKSTILQLLNRLLTPTEGVITLDDVPLADVPLRFLREQVGLVLQDHHIFKGTVLDNIGYGRGDIERERAVEACTLACAHEFIEALPRGYDTPVPEGGMGLSAGQKQRLSLARIFYRKPAVLLLDEVTSCLDGATEASILANVRKHFSDAIVIVVSHRPSAVHIADVALGLGPQGVIELRHEGAGDAEQFLLDLQKVGMTG